MTSSATIHDRKAATVFAGLFAACALFVGGCASNLPSYDNQQVFTTPKAAVQALESAADKNDMVQLESIFGPKSHDVLSSGDPVADRNQRQVFSVAMAQGWTLNNKNAYTRELIVGEEKWPFPIPLVKDGRGWWFDTAAGSDEVLARRIGRNELATIGALRIYAGAQREYAAEGHDGLPAGIYAQRIRSDPGKHNGLHWKTVNPDDPDSPLGDFAAAAAAEGYGGQPREGMAPYHGYFFRILTSQGADAPGGARNYIVGGRMTEGFAMLAYPADYANSGIMTFQVGPDGVVYEADLGEETLTIAGAIQDFNPGPGWQISK